MSKTRRPHLHLATSRPASRDLFTPIGTPGKVVHDERGNAIWDWAIETGVLARTSRGDLANQLADPARLTLEIDESTEHEWAGDPYNRRASGG